MTLIASLAQVARSTKRSMTTAASAGLQLRSVTTHSARSAVRLGSAAEISEACDRAERALCVHGPV